LPELLEIHAPREALLALGVYQAVEAPGEVLFEGVVEVRVEAFEVAGGERARKDVAELQGVVLACPALTLLLAERHVPEVEAVALEVLVGQGVEGVLGVDVGRGDTVQGVPKFVVVLAPVGLAEDLQELVEREGDAAVWRHAPAPLDELHDRDEDVLVDRAREPEVPVGRHPPVLLHPVPLARDGDAAGLYDVLATLLTFLQHEQGRLFQVDLDLDQGPPLVLEQPQLLRAVVQTLSCPFAKHKQEH
jgi:hypothetical protein